MAFGVENMERIVLAFGKSERIEIDGAQNLGVLSADVHDEAVVDEHPHVIVAKEFEVLAGNVFERCLDLHRKAVVVPFAVGGDVVVERVLDGVFGIEVLEVVEQEEAAFGALVVFLPKPEAVVVKIQFDGATGRVGVFLAVLLGHDLRQEPVVQMFRDLAFFGEVRCADRDSVWSKIFFDHALHVALRRVAPGASARAEVVAGGVHRAKIRVEVLGAVGIRRRHGRIAAVDRSLDVAIALGAMQPVEHHHGELFRRAVTQNAWVFFVNRCCGSDFFTGLDPDGVGFGCSAVERKQDALSCWIYFGVMDIAYIVVADGLLEVNLERSLRRGDSCFKPAAIVLDGGHVDRIAARNVENCRCVCPGGEEADQFSGRRGWARIISRSAWI